MNVGSIVRCRNRDWVLLPSDDPEVHRLRPLTGGTDDVVSVHRGLANLIGSDLPEERPRPAAFPPPAAEDVTDAAGASAHDGTDRERPAGAGLGGARRGRARAAAVRE